MIQKGTVSRRLLGAPSLALAVLLLSVSCAAPKKHDAPKANGSRRVEPDTSSTPGSRTRVEDGKNIAATSKKARLGEIAPLNTENSPWSVSELRKQARPNDASKVWVQGYVSIRDCTSLHPERKPCIFAEMGDFPYSKGTSRILLGGVPNDWEELKPGIRMRVLATFDERIVQPLTMRSSEGDGLNYLRHLQATPLKSDPSEPTYADGSWSAADLFKRHDLKHGEEISLTGYTTAIYTCPPCPPTALCKPCAQPHFMLSDDPEGKGEGILVGGYDEKKVALQNGKRILVVGVIESRVGSMSAGRGALLSYKSHSYGK